MEEVLRPARGVAGTSPGAPPTLSAVIPCRHEERCLLDTHRRLVAVLEPLSGIVFGLVPVDDDNGDPSLTLLRELQRADGRMRILSLSR